jgi:hypothetical protein
MSVLEGTANFIGKWMPHLLLNGAMLKTALNKLRHFPNLAIEDRIAVCNTLIRNGEVGKLVQRIQRCPDSIPIECVSSFYRAVLEDSFDPENDPFLTSEQQRLIQEIEKEAWVYSRKSMRESEELAIVRLAKLLDLFGPKGQELSYQIALWAYARYQWIPAELKVHMPSILINFRLAAQDARREARSVRWKKRSTRHFAAAS